MIARHLLQVLGGSLVRCSEQRVAQFSRTYRSLGRCVASNCVEVVTFDANAPARGESGGMCTQHRQQEHANSVRRELNFNEEHIDRRGRPGATRAECRIARVSTLVSKRVRDAAS